MRRIPRGPASADAHLLSRLSARGVPNPGRAGRQAPRAVRDPGGTWPRVVETVQIAAIAPDQDARDRAIDVGCAACAGHPLRERTGTVSFRALRRRPWRGAWGSSLRSAVSGRGRRGRALVREGAEQPAGRPRGGHRADCQRRGTSVGARVVAGRSRRSPPRPARSRCQRPGVVSGGHPLRGSCCTPEALVES